MIDRLRDPRWGAALFWGALTLLLAFGLYLRFANLEDVQPFDVDQGRDYMELYRWLRHGHWPLLGPFRSVGADFTIGPGWYYALAPMMLLTGMSLKAGAGTIAIAAMAGAALSAIVVRRLSGGAVAGLAAAALWCLAPNWVILDRFLWNPNLLPFVSVALLAIIAFADSHPYRCLVAYLMLVAITPQFHTTALLPLAASFPPTVAALWLARHSLRHTARWKVLLGVALLIVWTALLYVPPLIHEFTAEKGNLVPYFRNTFKGAPAFEAPAGERLRFVFQTITGNVLGHCFGNTLNPLAARIAAIAMLAGALAMVLARQSTPRHRGVACYTMLLTALYFYIVFRRGAWVDDYYMRPLYPLPGIVVCWAAGSLIASPGGSQRGRVERIAGASIVAVLMAWSLWNLSNATAVARGRAWYGGRLPYYRAVIKGIAATAAGRPFSLILLEEGNHAAHMHWLLIDNGTPPANWESYGTTIVDKEHFGDICFVIVWGKYRDYPIEVENLALALPEPGRDSKIDAYRLPAGIIPADRRAIDVYVRDGKLRFECTP